MASKFLKSNFKSMSKTDEEKLKEVNDLRKNITGIAAGEKEIKMLEASIPKDLTKILKFIEEEKE